MLKLKKNYSMEELKVLFEKGLVYIEPAYGYNTYGASSMGYIERKGIKINNVVYQVIYSSKAHGHRITSDLIDYNGSWYEKYNQYEKQVNEHFEKHYIPMFFK